MKKIKFLHVAVVALIVITLAGCLCFDQKEAEYYSADVIADVNTPGWQGEPNLVISTAWKLPPKISCSVHGKAETTTLCFVGYQKTCCTRLYCGRCVIEFWDKHFQASGMEVYNGKD